ncbi:lysozyme [Streptomyces sp. NPDC005423]|uniref:lysozyme n=1 Tax=Streptomyces sp. NPDC005423 TaxID=3155343 RepID=UPI0033A66665
MECVRRSIIPRPGRPRPRLRLAAVLLTLLALPVLPAASAAADPARPAPPARPARPAPPAPPALLAPPGPSVLAPPGSPESVPVRGNAYMGMGVAAHEGAAAPSGAPAPATRAGQTEGVDVSSHQQDVAWSTLWRSGTRWAYTKATEGTSYTNPYFSQQYSGAYGVGMVRGAYHFAAPDSGSGAAQADYFVDHGGGWSGGGRTLPGVLDIEWNPYGDSCYGKSADAMTGWIGDFLSRYKARTGRDAVIYTSASWWNSCTGGYRGFAANPLWVARYASSAGELPAGWPAYTMWQYTSTGPTVGDHDRFNGSPDALGQFAAG